MYNVNQITDMFRSFMNVSQITDISRRNVEALTSANKSLVEGFQAIAQRQMEINKEAVAKGQEFLKDMMTTATPQTNATRTTELAKSMMESNVRNARELAEMAAECNKEVLSIVSSRVSESLSEISAAAPTATAATKRKSA